MSSSLSRVPIEKRRHLAAVCGLFAVLFIAIAAVAGTGGSSPVLIASIAVAVLVALVLALMSWGLVRSVQLELADKDLDAAIEEALAAQGGSLRDLTCGCGHDHDPDALHVTDDPCSRDGIGHECSRTCDTCVLSRLSRSATAESVRPRPTPRPR